VFNTIGCKALSADLSAMMVVGVLAWAVKPRLNRSDNERAFKPKPKPNSSNELAGSVLPLVLGLSDLPCDVVFSDTTTSLPRLLLKITR